jgi:DNA-binding MarR family transcriptional regulator
MASAGKGAKGKRPQWTLATSPSHLLHRAQQVAADLFARNTGTSRDDLTPRQFAVLAALAERDGCSQSDLTAMTGIDRSTLADLLSRMAKRGLVARRKAPDDARANEVRLTSDGRAAWLQAAPAAIEADLQLLAALPRQRRETFVSLLGLLATIEDESAPRVSLVRPTLLPDVADTGEAGDADEAGRERAEVPPASPKADKRKTKSKADAKAKKKSRDKPKSESKRGKARKGERGKKRKS